MPGKPPEPLHFQTHEDGPKTLTKADCESIAEELVKRLPRHYCQFDEEARVALRILAKSDPKLLVKIIDAYTDATSFIWKGALALVIVGTTVALILVAILKIKVPFFE